MVFNKEEEIVSYIFDILKSYFCDNNKIVFEKEGSLNYKLPNNKVLSHKSDILIRTEKNTFISIEVKYKSAVTDQFKCRSYDMLHLKNQFGSKILGVLIFVKVKGNGISREQAKDISYPFDIFVGIDIKDIENKKLFFDLFNEVNNYINKIQ